jgi:hypothetical protein
MMKKSNQPEEDLTINHKSRLRLRKIGFQRPSASEYPKPYPRIATLRLALVSNLQTFICAGGMKLNVSLALSLEATQEEFLRSWK